MEALSDADVEALVITCPLLMQHYNVHYRTPHMT